MTRIQHRLPWNAAETRSASIHQKYCFAYLRTTGEVRRNRSQLAVSACGRINVSHDWNAFHFRIPFSPAHLYIYYYSR